MNATTDKELINAIETARQLSPRRRFDVASDLLRDSQTEEEEIQQLYAVIAAIIAPEIILESPQRELKGDIQNE